MHMVHPGAPGGLPDSARPSREVIGKGTGVHPRERSCVRPIYIWGAAASLEPGEATRVGTVALAGGGRRVCHGAPATTAQDHSVWRFSISRYNTCKASS